MDKLTLSKEDRHERFTPENQQRRRDRANKPFIPRGYFFNCEASKDGIIHFAQGIGDENPLFTDEEYANATKYGSIVAPGSYLYSVRWGSPGAMAPGVHGWYVRGDWEWYRPIHSGDKFRLVCVLREFVEKRGKMGGGRTWIDYNDVIYLNQRGEIVGKELGHIVMAEREAASSAEKWRHIPKTVYGKEDWTRILDLYENEEKRGGEVRSHD